MPRLAKNAACTQAKAVFGKASPFQLESAPVRVTLKALKAVPQIAMALAVSAGLSPSARETLAATAKEPRVV